MDVYLITGTHFSQPSQIRRLGADPLNAAEVALDLVNSLRRDLDPQALPVVTEGSWIDALAEAQRYRIATLGISPDNIADEDLPELAAFDVWMEILTLDIDADRMAAPLPPIDACERDAIVAGLRLLQSRGCPVELLDVATGGGSHLILADAVTDALCERLNKHVRPAPPRVIVALEGGLVSGVVADQPILLRTVDYDVEGAAEDEITEIPQGNGQTASAVAGDWSKSLSIDKDWLDAAFTAIKRDEREQAA